jgi:hypothetical protein
MSHLFAQVKVKATTTSVSGQPVIKSMSGVTVTPGNPVDLTIATGAVAQNATAAAQNVLTWNDLNTTTVMSDPITVNTGSSNPIYVNISSVTIDGYLAFTGVQATFKKALTAGYSYTLVVNFKKTIWAKSNIYWVSTGGNTGYLTFDTQENGNQGYQGVFFKWGSLVGVSPAPIPPIPIYAFSSSTPVYIPNYDKNNHANSSWVRDDDHSYSSWTTPILSTAESDAGTIPYLDGSYDDAGTVVWGGDNRLAIDATQNTDAMYEGLRGDICQYLSKTEVVSGSYRLPTAHDFGIRTTSNWADNPLTPNADGWIKGGGSFILNATAGREDGTADLLDAAKNNGNTIYGSAINRPMGNVVFPAAGRRSNIGGLDLVGNYGVYWTGSAQNPTDGYNLDFHSTYIHPGRTSYRSYGFPIRCVQN